MIVQNAARDIQRSSNFTERTMGLAVGSEAFVFNVLRKDLYSDPIGSLIREYTVNAQDEHRKYGKTDIPIFIQVPNSFSPELHIRDYAGGLTEEQVFNFFGNYGASDKRESNEAVGFFGLGCKSAFAYTDSYIVKSFKDGMEYTFNIYIDETEIGKTAKISAEPTTKPNGVLIIVPVKTHDINTFQRKVLSTVKYFKTKPIIGGMTDVTFDTKKSVIKGEGWEFFGNGSPTVIMGEIPYPLDYYEMGEIEGWESSLLHSEINIYVNIGDVQVTASREALQMSPKTINAIRAKLKGIKDAMIAETKKAFVGAKNLIEAKELYNSIVVTSGGYSNIIRNCGNDLTWKGEVLKDNIIRFDSSLHRITTYYKGGRRRYSSSPSDVIKTDFGTAIQCDGRSKIYFDDTDGTAVGYKRRARTLLNGDITSVTVIHTTDVKALETILGMSVKDLPSYNAVVPTVASSSRVGGTGVDLTKRAKHTSKVFVLNVSKVMAYSYGSASEFWDLQEVDNLNGVYIPIDRFKPNLPNAWDISSLRTLLTDLSKAGITIDVPIYGIKKGGDTQGLVRFDAWIDKAIASNTMLVENYKKVKTYTEFDLLDVSNLRADKLPDSSTAKSYALAFLEIRKAYMDSRKNDCTTKVFRHSSVKVEPDKAVATLSKEFSTKYPMLTLVSSYEFQNAVVVDYILERDGQGDKALSS